ncbi:hypothetical protein [Photobacterium damselae]|nr:hypothetical protein [Photobacterium damselae]NVO73217.1 hypothetical protein [Photobacterium damselae subsp. damselae]PSB81847.1 hypothetical protein C5F61_01225 [Photobacterium damselae subsp. damselae]PSB83041.1 hypothetical protein C5F62_08620 [Photobacterium damselae subsp. damselae]UKA30626.1 hypothetical protein IPQ37_13225 [Photobacterium damselae subsp. damselae]
MFPKIPGVSTGGGSLDLGGGGPSSNHSTTNNQNGFSGGTLNMGSSFGIPTWAILVAGCVAAYLVLKK